MLDQERKPGREKKQTPEKTVRKIGSQALEALSFASCHIKDNAEVIHVHIRSRGVEGLIFVQVTFEKCTKKFYFEDGEVGNNQQIVALISMKRFHIFTHFYTTLFSIKTCFYETSNVFLLRVLEVFSQNC